MRPSPALLLAAILAPILAGGCGVELEHGLDERQANEIAALLESTGVAVEKHRDEGAEVTPGGWMIVVPRGEVSRSVQLLSAHDLPRRDRRGLAETLAERSLLPTLAEEHARLESARAVELERTLERAPGVRSARVHLALPDPGRLDAQAPPRAAILLRTDGATGGLSEAGVRALVSGAVAGLAERDVMVVLANDPPLPAPEGTEPVGPLRVARGERGRVVAIAASGLALVVLLGAALLVTALRLGARTRLGERLSEDQSVAPKRTG